ncbi:hypothetical protein [Nocardioides bruguierae]|uniref:Uncharacterized protein n=1 Tax=Nocardioides bruguierae TaxID=2945102 RepID=A0A9X2IE96_9ACTN|nr:hypothetical protein [Nocardioides bruguierae]MCM0619823.1 hypothetical protein [Nocardioides bruguierae]
MTSYQLAPYLVRVHVRGKPNESRPLDDLQPKAGLDLATELAGLLSAHVGKLYRKPQTKAGVRPQRIQVVSVGQSGRTLNFVASPGRSGIESRTLKRDGSAPLSRAFDDVELIEHRHFLAYAANAHWAILLAERIAGDGVVTDLRELMTKVWTRRHPDLVLTINPAGDEQLWDTVLENRPVKQYIFSRATTSDGKLSVSDKGAKFELHVRPAERGARFGIKPLRARATKEQKPLKEIFLQEVTPVLAGEYETPEEGAAALMEQPWSVAVQLELDSGQSPTVNIEQDSRVTMTWAIIDGVDEPASRPSDEDVIQAVRRLVKADFFAKNGLGQHHADSLQWTPGPWQYSGQKPWEVLWDVDTTGAQADAPGADAS